MPAVYAIQMREDFLHYVWKHQRYDVSGSRTVCGKQLIVLHPGQYLRTSGPDFFNGRIELDGQIWAGNIEVHIRASDWYLHHHETDPAYDNVILHVVWEHDVDVFRSDGSVLPVLELRQWIDAADLSRYDELLRPKHWINCERQISGVDSLLITNFFERLLLERLEEKILPLKQLLQELNNDWDVVFFIALAGGFGLHANGNAFRNMAHSIPYAVIRREAGDVINLEALFFAQCDLLRGDCAGYRKQLRERADYLIAKHQLTRIEGNMPEFFKQRPDNFPTIRLAQIAQLFHREQNLFSNVILASAKEIYRQFSTGVSAYWETHYTFDRTHPPRKKRLTTSFIDLLIINVVVPLRFLYLEARTMENSLSVTSLLESLKPENNTIISRFGSAGVVARNAFESQALLQLKHQYCDKLRCMECRIGVSLLRPG